MLVVGINYLFRKSMVSRNYVNTVATALIYRKKLHILLFMTILCQWVFILTDFEYPSFYLPNALAQEVQAEPVACITYDSEENIIRIDCEHANLTDIDNQLKDPDLLHKETENGVWLLNAGVVVENGATLYINSTDTSWLRIVTDGETAHHILVSGSLKIDSVKITSWNLETNDYEKFEVEKENGAKEADYPKKPRPFITVDEKSTSSTEITNSEIAYLGYLSDGIYGYGLTFFGGNKNLLAGNDIHHNFRGFYSEDLGGEMIIEDNYIHSNYQYGLDPHTGTHDMNIRNNTIYDNGAIGIICSLDCYNITIEDNEVNNNFGYGIMFSRNMYHSVARNNYVYNETNCISVNTQSHNNEVYNNRVSECENGIDLRNEAYNNDIHHNIIIESGKGIKVHSDASSNTFHYNTIITNPNEIGISVNADTEDNRIDNNQVIDSKLQVGDTNRNRIRNMLP
jgi:mannuronan 5-epimerase